MKAFEYNRAASVEDAVAGAAAPGARFIAGGTNLLDLMKLQVMTPETLVDISRLPLDQVEHLVDAETRIGALVPNSDLAANPLIRQHYTVLSKALLAGASGQLRNKASTGGNLLQRTRCYYFYDPSMACNKREPGTGCSAQQGFNRILAILGTSEHCIATHPSDMAVAMRALDAVIHTLRPDGSERAIPIADFYRLPGDTPHIETVLEQGELITTITLPPPPPGVQLYRKVRDRASYAFALVSVAAVIDVQEGRIAGASLAFGGLAHMPWRDPQVEAALIGQAPSPALFDAAADALLEGARGYGHNDFKIPLARRTLAAVLRQAVEMHA
ncbi:FAD binding domain-containing protein [Sphingomonas xinjiangensis]|uniref:Xanthine dehydrogenase YagS FAD-binding subunit n=1 Tax=Sphingomonas xinjiangensis TaxID=643568 RepID=A0A840YMI0_9SPHN|nr:xanthine dehydrogenase family protein subunit M [Sphingomonas xinjiangensis]MBB5711056.1 xanthine dehydrogenase YagS FAD-binding subunit [Sphingomonas xinjiangensis]